MGQSKIVVNSRLSDQQLDYVELISHKQSEGIRAIIEYARTHINPDLIKNDNSN